MGTYTCIAGVVWQSDSEEEDYDVSGHHLPHQQCQQVGYIAVLRVLLVVVVTL